MQNAMEKLERKTRKALISMIACIVKSKDPLDFNRVQREHLKEAAPGNQLTRNGYIYQSSSSLDINSVATPYDDSIKIENSVASYKSSVGFEFGSTSTIAEGNDKERGVKEEIEQELQQQMEAALALEQSVEAATAEAMAAEMQQALEATMNGDI